MDLSYMNKKCLRSKKNEIDVEVNEK